MINWNRCKRCGAITRTKKEIESGHCKKCLKILSNRKRYKSMMEGKK